MKAFLSWIKKFLGIKEEPQRPDEVIEPVKDPIEPSDYSKRIFDVAMGMVGKFKEVPGSGNNPDIVNMFKVVTGKEQPDSTAWCAVACGYTLEQAGFKSLNTMLARDYLKYGESVDSREIQPGDIVVFKRGSSSWRGHVAFFDSWNEAKTHLRVIGGNQSDEYRISSYDSADLLGVRRPTSYDLKSYEARRVGDTPDIDPLWSDDFFGQDRSRAILIIHKNLGSLSPKDLNNYIPRGVKYYNNDFWMLFLSAMAKKESNHNTKTAYQENFKDSKGNYVISRGLFQLSVESVNGYNKFGVPRVTAGDLHDPIINFECAVKILAHWIKKDGVIASDSAPWKGGARYWSVLRNNSNHEWIKKTCKERMK